MAQSHILGYPRIGSDRQTKRAVEAYWSKEITASELHDRTNAIKEANWLAQKQAGLDYVTVNDFSCYDHVLDMSALLGVVPERFESTGDVSVDTYFRMARGRAPTGKDVPACEMTKWFDTNYHYIVPELADDQTFSISCPKLFGEVDHAKGLGYQVKPVLVGPITYLWLSKAKGQNTDKLVHLDKLVAAYEQILTRLSEQGVEWVQVDEPALSLDLPKEWVSAFPSVYERLNQARTKIMIATYFGSLEENLNLIGKVACQGWHLDRVRGQDDLNKVLQWLPSESVLSLGVIDGRNIWKADLSSKLESIRPVYETLGERLWVSTSCSLLHSPVDLDNEVKIDKEIKSWLAFAKQKLGEVALLKQALVDPSSVADELKAFDACAVSRQTSTRIHNQAVKDRIDAIDVSMRQRQNRYQTRAKAQKEALQLPLAPTTTIGSFPQTKEIRSLRRNWKKGDLSTQEYETQIKAQIQHCVKVQEEIGLDVLVHGEAERNDMVEYFGELLDGYAFTQNGWVQSYGSRCVKPPIIYGDVSRRQPMTVEWTAYAQSLTTKWMKGMLTGPVTMLFWSFVRDDQPRSTTANQIALALRDELIDLEKANIKIIQLDEPAFREGLPLRKKEWLSYLEWAVDAFRLSTSGVQDSTQVHTHMCYSEFNDVIESIAALDADVITIETSRSDMELLEAFEDFQYPNEIGPGVYDIHSPIVPCAKDMVSLMEKAASNIPVERLWVNPDCGLKTRGWPETIDALKEMVKAAQIVRETATQKEPELA